MIVRIWAASILRALFVILLGCVGGIASGAAMNTYTDAAVKEKLLRSDKHIICDFEADDALPAIVCKGDIIQTQISRDADFVKQGQGSLKLTVDDKADKNIGGNPVLVLELKGAQDLSKYQGLSFWMYVSPTAANYFYGRYDIRLYLNEGKIVNTWPAIKAGWNFYSWDFKDQEALPEVSKLSFRLGPLLEGYDRTELYIDEVALIPMDKVAGNEDFGAIALKDSSWSRRYNALRGLSERQDENLATTTIQVFGDEARVIRNLAVSIMSHYVEQHGKSVIGELDEGMANDNWRVRLSTIKLVGAVKAQLGGWADSVMKAALFDDNFYVRDYSINLYLQDGLSKADVADFVIPRLSSSEGLKLPQAIRIISEIGPRAEKALPYIIAILRDQKSDMATRHWALQALWAIDETVLTPQDWLIGLHLEPDSIHTHLLNRAMDRLEIAGERSVAVLTETLKASDPQMRARAAVILGNIGPDAKGAERPLKTTLQDKCWYVAWEAQQALSKILPDYAPLKEYVSKEKGKLSEQDVNVIEGDQTITVSNGLIELVFEKGDDSPGPKIVRRPGGKNLVEADWLDSILAFKHSKAPNMIERQWLQRLFGSPFSRNVETQLYKHTDDFADYMIKFVGSDYAPVQFEYHYVLRRGNRGFYSYIITRNVTGKDIARSEEQAGQVGIGRFTYLIALTWNAFDHLIIHDKLKGPATFTTLPDEPTTEGYPDIYQCTYRLPTGQVYAKHEWEEYELFGNVTGYTGSNGGFWMIFPNYDFFGDSMPRLLKKPCYGHLFIPHLEGKYYISCGTRITADWEKIYGPMYFYINNGENTEEMWVDAKRQAQEEVSQWPYTWLGITKYHDRGKVKGKLTIADGSSPHGAYVVLSNPTSAADPDQFGVWMRNVGPYQYWTKVANDGSFAIDDVHQGHYRLYAFKPGVFAELDHGSISVHTDKVTDVGRLALAPLENGKLLWQIGVPDGGCMEYKNGRNYHQWTNYIRYREDFPQDVHYVIGKSDWTKDFNYMHPACVQDEWKPITWTIDFDLQELPARQALLSIMCSGRAAHAEVILNGKKIGDLKVSIGVHHVRTAPYGELVLKEYTISPAQLIRGKNTIQLTFAQGLAENDAARERHFKRWTSWLAYDFLRFEVQ